MATFKVGSWVQITPHPDTRWEYWSDDHSALTGEFGEITEIEVPEDDPSVTYFHIVVYDEHDDPCGQQWFLGRHMIMATKYDNVVNKNFQKICDDLQKWEKKRRKMLDDGLRRVFGLSEDSDGEKKKKICAMKGADMWEETTEDLEQDAIDEALEMLDGFDYDEIWKCPPDGAD